MFLNILKLFVATAAFSSIFSENHKVTFYSAKKKKNTKKKTKI